MKQRDLPVKNKASRARRLGVFTAAICAAAAAAATDLEDFYFRHDFSDGAVKTYFGASSTLTKDPLASYKAVSVYGQDGAGTAVHPGNPWGTPFGDNNASSYLNSDWSIAASVRVAPVEGGVVFNLGQMSVGCKSVAVCSSSADGRLYIKVMKRTGQNTRSVETSVNANVGNTLDGFHSIVLVYNATSAGTGSFTLYFDGERAATAEATSSTPFGNGFQYASLLSCNASQCAGLGCAMVNGNTALAFQDARVFRSALTAEDAAAYATLYPATLPEFTENPDEYAYVQSYGGNGVDTGVYMTDTDKFTADFAFTDVSSKAWICGAGKNAHKQTHGIYLSYNNRLAWTNRGEWWFDQWILASNGSEPIAIGADTLENNRTRVTATPDLSATCLFYEYREYLTSAATTYTATQKGPSDLSTHLFRGNGIMDNDGQASKAKIYSFEVDATASDTIPRAFLAPAEDANGAAGFIDVVDGAFHGECMENPQAALTFTPGVGQASDYRYRSGKFYSRIYAISANPANGLVKFEGGEAAGTNAQFTARGKTAKIIAVPASGFNGAKWSGDTWAIQDVSVDGLEITVKSDIAIRLSADFTGLPEWSNTDGTGSLDSAENWTTAPNSGDSVLIHLSGDTAFTSNGEVRFGGMTIDGAYSADFSGAGTVTCSSVLLDGATNLTTGGKMRFSSLDMPSGSAATITGAEGIKDGGLTGSGTLTIDPGDGNVFTMSKDNNGFTGEVVVKSGVARFGNVMSFGPPARAAFIRVKGGAALDEGTNIKYYPSVSIKLSKAILEEGAVLQADTGYDNANTEQSLQYSVLTDLALEGNATVDTSFGIVTLAQRYHYNAVSVNLGEHVLAVSGGKTFGVSHATIAGTGTIDVQSGTTVVSTQSYGGDSTTVCADGTIRIREGGKWHLAYYYNNHNAHLSVKNLVLEGAVTRDRDTFTLTVTGSITGNGTTPTLTMGEGAVFKPTGTGYLTITESLAGTMTIYLPETVLNNSGTMPLFKTGTAEILPEEDEIAFADGIDHSEWRLRKTRDGLGYDLVRAGTVLILR